MATQNANQFVDDNNTEEDYESPTSGQYKVFSNSVVWRVLGRYLNFSDLKALRLVSRDFNSLVLNETNFKNRTLINLFQSRLKRQEFGSTTVLWRNFKIQLHCFENEENTDQSGGGEGETFKDNSDLSTPSSSSSVQKIPQEKEDWISPLLKSAESLTITVIPYVYGPRKRDYPNLHLLLEAPDNLKKLVLDVNIFDITTENNVFTELTEKIRTTLENLIEFHIDSCGFKIVTHHNDSDFTDSTGMCAAVMKNLQVLKVGHIIDDGIDTGIPDSVDNELHLKIQNLIGISEENKTHLTHLHLEDMQLWATPNDNSLQSVVKKDFINLKSVIIRANQIEKNNLIDFFKRHSPLEQLDITILDTFSNELFDIIRSKSTNLKNLRIKTKGFEKSEENMWNFLTKCQHLESFQLDCPISNRYSPNVESHNVIFMNLPKSIKKISLNGYFPHTEILTSPDFGNLNPWLLTTMIIKKSQQVVNDETLEWIFKNCKMIQIFTLTNNSVITDYGLTGIPENTELVDEEPKFSIKNLKGMKSLTLQSCSRLTDEICRHAIQFKELTYLDLSENDAITETGVQQVLKNNPSLEVLKTSEFDTFPMEEEVRKQHPRFQIHIFTDGAESDDGDDSLRHDLGGSDFSGPFDYDFYDDYYNGSDDHDDDEDNHYDDEYYMSPFEREQYEDHYK